MPELPEEKQTAEEAAEDEQDRDLASPLPTRAGHGRAPSLSLQSKMRSSSFRRTSITQGSPGAALKSPDLESSAVADIYKKQAQRIEELEKENSRLEKEAGDGEVRWRKSEEEVEELREKNGELEELRTKLEKSEKKMVELEELVCGSDSPVKYRMLTGCLEDGGGLAQKAEFAIIG